MNHEQQLNNFLSFPNFFSYFTFKTELCYKTNIDWDNSVTSAYLFPRGPLSDPKRDLFPEAEGGGGRNRHTLVWSWPVDISNNKINYNIFENLFVVFLFSLPEHLVSYYYYYFCLLQHRLFIATHAMCAIFLEFGHWPGTRLNAVLARTDAKSRWLAEVSSFLKGGCSVFFLI